MEVVLCSPRGFCAGVVRAIQSVEVCLKRFGPPVYVKHQIVHNPFVVADLESKGAVTVEEPEEVLEGSVVVFSAHGSPPEDYERARKRNLKVIDATCPLVTKVHNEARRYASQGRRTILLGHRGHQEVRGTMGQAPLFLIDVRERLTMPNWDSSTPVAVLTQTTLSLDDTAQAIEGIRGRFPNAVVHNGICYATTNRQRAVKELAQEVDLVLVIGAQNSSNCNRLREVAEAQGVSAYLINGPSEVREEWREAARRIGITSGASTPEVLVDSVVTELNPEKVSAIEGVAEDVSFRLPRELRAPLDLSQ